MAIILIWTGNPLPAFTKDCVDQLKIFNPDETIYLITERDSYIGKRNNYMGLCNEYLDTIDKIKEYTKLSIFDKKSLWDTSCKRLFYLEQAMRITGLDKVWHIENDNLVYANLKNINYPGKGIYIGDITTTLKGAGIMFVNGLDLLTRLNDHVLDLFRLGRAGIEAKYGNEFLSEMRFLSIIEKNFMQKEIITLDTLPNDKKIIYDTDAWGQFLDGITATPGVSRIFDIHIIGQYLLSLPESERHIDWHVEDGLKVPYIKDNKFINLHIHGKRLNLWKSK